MTQETQKERDRRFINRHHEANERPIAAGPRPKVGETWAPCAPWPAQGCPTGMYVNGYSEALVGGKAGWHFGLVGHTHVSLDAPPMTHGQATAAAWEYRYGSASFACRSSDKPLGHGAEASVFGLGRYGDGPVVVEAVGSNTIFARRPDGVAITLYAVDLHQGWMRVAEVAPPLAEVCT